MARKRRRPELSVRAGDTFLLLRPHNHLYVVCPNPAIDSKHILIVNFVTYNHLEENCCLSSKGEHPFFKG